MALYSGKAVGGPYDGKPIHHGLPTIKVAMAAGKVITYCGPPTEEITVGEYRHNEGKWLWSKPIS
jgi:hypothetical protein